MAPVFVVLVLVSPPMLAFLRARAEATPAREGSELEAARTSFCWAAALLTLDPLLLGVMFAALRSGSIVLAIAVGALLVGNKLSFLRTQRCVLTRLRRLSDEAACLPETTCTTGPATRVSDIGVGVVWRGRPAGMASYREAPELSRLVIGDAEEARRLVAQQLRLYLRLHLALYGTPLAIAAFFVVIGAVVTLVR